MHASDLADRPLAGCHWLMEDELNAETLIEHLRLRVSLYYDGDLSQIIFDEIISEYWKTICVFPKPSPSHLNRPFQEYVINEIQYQIRKGSGKTSDQLESNIITEWVNHITKEHCLDDALEFISLLKKNRNSRNRVILISKV